MKSWFFHPGSTISGWLLGMVGGGRVEGLEHVPHQGPFILVANHRSLADPPIIGWAVGHKVGRVLHFMAKEEMRRWPIIGWLAEGSGVFFVRRGEGDRAAQRAALRLLAEGRPIAIFPEGTRSKDGRLGSAKPGAALLAIRSGAPLLPVAITGTERLFPGHSRVPHRTRVVVRIGPPFALEHLPSGRIPRELLSEGTDRIMCEIAKLIPVRSRPG
jgi:1-acyl-sn-glycerol-3-phosphate acyltransferase